VGFKLIGAAQVVIAGGRRAVSAPRPLRTHGLLVAVVVVVDLAKVVQSGDPITSLERSDVRAGMIRPGGPVVRASASLGWQWGGGYRSLKPAFRSSASTWSANLGHELGKHWLAR
jgi:hypothetical protein